MSQIQNSCTRETPNLPPRADNSTNPKLKINVKKININDNVSFVICYLLLVTCHMSHVTYHMSFVNWDIVHVTCYMSNVKKKCHLSSLMCHLLPVTIPNSHGPDIPLTPPLCSVGSFAKSRNNLLGKKTRQIIQLWKNGPKFFFNVRDTLFNQKSPALSVPVGNEGDILLYYTFAYKYRNI